MQVSDLRLKGLKLIVPYLFFDERGFFFESYRASKYAEFEIFSTFVQDNISCSKRGVIRGLHYQSAPGQAKLVSCLYGKIWDVAVDIRPDSPTFGQWEGVFLDDRDRHQMFIPIGFAHGFCALSDGALIQYKVSSAYNPCTEQSIRWNDPDLAISWPIQEPFLCERDLKSPLFKEIERRT